MSEKIEVGSIVEGKVIKTKPFGAIVALSNNTQGLVHISHISASFVQNIADYVKIGDVVKVKILSMDAETGKISLSIKEAVAESQGQFVPKKTAYSADFRQKTNSDSNTSFEDKFKEWLKASNERQAGLNKRNKRR